jgi:hypothetical protein
MATTILDPGERWVYSCAMPITARTTNVATATGIDMLGNRWRDSELGAGAHLTAPASTVAGVQDTEACHCRGRAERKRELPYCIYQVTRR